MYIGDKPEDRVSDKGLTTGGITPANGRLDYVEYAGRDVSEICKAMERQRQKVEYDKYTDAGIEATLRKEIGKLADLASETFWEEILEPSFETPRGMDLLEQYARTLRDLAETFDRVRRYDE